MRAIAAALLLLACGGNGGGGEADAGGGEVDARAGADSGPGGGWTALAPLPAPRQETAVASLDGRIYVIGGFVGDLSVVDTVEVYDPASDTWATAEPLPQPLHHANVAVVGDRLFVLGALRALTFAAVGDVYEYDLAADMWTPRIAMPAGSERGASAVGAIGDIIYVAGGSRGGSVADFSAYDTTTHTWTPLPALPEARDHLVGGAVGGRFYAIGGRNGGVGQLRAQVDIFDPGTGAWTSGAPMPTARGGSAAAVLDGRIHVCGGEGHPTIPSGVFADHEAYDPATDAWETLTPMLTPRHGTGAATTGGKLYIPGGADVQAFGAVATMEVWAP